MQYCSDLVGPFWRLFASETGGAERVQKRSGRWTGSIQQKFNICDFWVFNLVLQKPLKYLFFFEFALNGDYTTVLRLFQEFSVWRFNGGTILAVLCIIIHFWQHWVSSVPQTRLKTILNKYKLRTGLNQTLNSIQLYPILRNSLRFTWNFRFLELEGGSISDSLLFPASPPLEHGWNPWCFWSSREAPIGSLVAMLSGLTCSELQHQCRQDTKQLITAY